MTKHDAPPHDGSRGGCLDAAALDRLGAGATPQPHESAHLASCGRCASALRSAAEDHALLASLARAAAAGTPTPDGTPAGAARAALSRVLPEGTRLADFTIRGVLGRGGMGVVYAAEQDSPRRLVALKLVQPDAATPEALRRFEHEAAALAALSHPGIAQVYSAGVAPPIGPDGPRASEGEPHPYIAMELISGKPLEGFAEDAALGIRERLALIVAVCEAVDHAHRRGVIHRDLKPSNILVRQAADGPARPTVVDFGVAKLRGPVGPGADTMAAVTHDGAFVGTLAFASPEQVCGDPGAVDARTDVYSLGVILYRLVTGRHPYDLGGSLADAVRTIAGARIIPPRQAAPGIDSELALVLRTALAADPERRYRSAAHLAEDLRRYLECRPLSARGDSTRYVLGKAIMRHKYRTAAAGLVAAALLAVGAGMLVFRFRAAEAEQRKGRVLDAVMTQLELVNPEDPNTPLVNSIPAFLDHTAEKVKEQLAKFPAEQADILSRLGKANMGQLRFEPAIEQLTEVAKYRRTVADRDPGALASALIDLGRAHEKKGDLKEALATFEEAWRVRRDHLGEDHIDTIAVRYYMGTALNAMKRYPEATEHFRAAAEAQSRAVAAAEAQNSDDLQDKRRDHAKYLTALAGALRGDGEFELALAAARESLGVVELADGAGAKGAAFAISNIVANLISLGRLQEALPLAERGLRIREESYGPHDPRLASPLVQLSMIHFRLAAGAPEALRQPYYDAAALHAQRALDLRRSVHKADHDQVAEALSVVGRATMYAGRRDEALAALREALEMRRRLPRAHDGDLGVSESLMGECLMLAGDHAEAEPLLRSGLERLRAAYGDDALRTIEARDRLRALLLRTGREVEAAALDRPPTAAND